MIVRARSVAKARQGARGSRLGSEQKRTRWAGKPSGPECGGLDHATHDVPIKRAVFQVEPHRGNIERASIGFGKRFPRLRFKSAPNVPKSAGIGVCNVQARHDRVELAKGGSKREGFHEIRWKLRSRTRIALLCLWRLTRLRNLWGLKTEGRTHLRR
jgi:hypothetical protein